MPKSTVDKSSEQEAFVAHKLEAKRTPRSGATIHRKGDIQDEYSLIECKTYMTPRESFTVKKEWFIKMHKERFEDRKQFAFLVQNFGGEGSQDNYVVIDLDTFSEMYEAYKQFIEWQARDV